MNRLLILPVLTLLVGCQATTATQNISPSRTISTKVTTHICDKFSSCRFQVLSPNFNNGESGCPAWTCAFIHLNTKYRLQTSIRKSGEIKDYIWIFFQYSQNALVSEPTQWAVRSDEGQALKVKSIKNWGRWIRQHNAGIPLEHGFLKKRSVGGFQVKADIDPYRLQPSSQIMKFPETYIQKHVAAVERLIKKSASQ